MSFNKNTWTKDYTGSPGLRALAAQDKRLAIQREEAERKAKPKK